MEHDPLCELVLKRDVGLRRGWLCDCQRFREVREDERGKPRRFDTIEYGNMRYAAALSDAAHAVLPECCTACGYGVGEAAVAAIKALGGER